MSRKKGPQRTKATPTERASKGAEVKAVKIQITLTPEYKLRLDVLCQALGVGVYPPVIREALRLLEQVYKAAGSNGKLLIERQDGKRFYILVRGEDADVSVSPSDANLSQGESKPLLKFDAGKVGRNLSARSGVEEVVAVHTGRDLADPNKETPSRGSGKGSRAGSPATAEETMRDDEDAQQSTEVLFNLISELEYSGTGVIYLLREGFRQRAKDDFFTESSPSGLTCALSNVLNRTLTPADYMDEPAKSRHREILDAASGKMAGEEFLQELRVVLKEVAELRPEGLGFAREAASVPTRTLKNQLRNGLVVYYARRYATPYY